MKIMEEIKMINFITMLFKTKQIIIYSIILFTIIQIGFASAVPLFNNPYSAQTTQPRYQNPTSFQQFNGAVGADFKTFWPGFGKSDDPNACQARQDFILQIAPGSCSPSVVRSDLLESQNVPVFCPVTAVKINPLVDIGEIQSVSFSGSGALPDGVAGISFYPYRAALAKKDNLFTSPGIANIGNVLGYAVVVLKQNPNEKNMSDAIIANLTANIKYDVKKIFGSGKSEYYLSLLDDAEWGERHSEYSFFKGNGFIRLDEMALDGSTAGISVYKDRDTVLRTVNVPKGSQSEIIYLPGSYCNAGVRIKYVGADVPKPRIKIQVDNDFLWLREGDKFLDNRCAVKSIQVVKQRTGNLNDTIARISCSGSGGNIELRLSEIDQSLGTYNLNWDNVLKQVPQDEAKKIKENFEKEKESAFLVADLYPSARADDGKMYGVKDLQKAAESARLLGQFAVEKEILEKLIAKYSGSGEADDAKNRIDQLIKYSYAKATAFATIDYNLHAISLVDYNKPAESEASVQFSIPNEARRAGDFIYWDGAQYNDNKQDSPNWARVQNIGVDGITIQAKTTQIVQGQTPIVQTKSYTMREGQFLSDIEGLVIPGFTKQNDVRLEKINVKVEARIEVVPEVPKAGSSGNFTFAVGIEKRGIQLSPDRTEEMIRNLNESIQKWTNIVNNLGKLVEAGKATCFAGSTALFVKNFISNTGGGAAARKEVMRGPGGWFEQCKKEVDNGMNVDKYKTIDSCLLYHDDDIEKDVAKWKSGEAEVTGKLDYAYGSNPNDEKAAREAFIKEFANEVCEGNLKGKKVYIESLKDYKLICDEKNGIYKSKDAILAAYRNGDFSVDDARTMMISARAYDSAQELNSESKSLGSQRLYGFFTNQYKRPGTGVANFANTLGDERVLDIYSASSKDVRTATVKVVEPVNGKIGNVNVPQGQYIMVSPDRSLPLGDASKGLAGGLMIIPVVKNSDGGLDINPQGERILIKPDGTSGTFTPEQYSEFVAKSNLRFRSFSETEAACSNAFVNPKVKYFTTGQYAGLPAVVPLDQSRAKKGWYVAMKDGPLAPYTEAGQVKTFWICNVGPNGREEFDSSTADDKDTCFQVNLQSGTVVKDMFCFTNDESQGIIQQAQQAIQQAGKYDQGRSAVTVFGKSYQIERVAASVTGSQCQDFMSPSDCNIMFNICDPVLCPSSRCNLGGAYTVDNVVQSGIIGSIALCLPNAKEGIYVPVCLTGVQAGLDAYVSVLKAHRDCLQDSLNGGQKVGICDQIQSVYLCEFFWRQSETLVKAGVPKLIEGVFSSGTRGGGEYSNMKQAFDTADKSFNYFTQVYGQNAFTAFKLRSTADVGSEVCRRFVSARYPNDANFFKNLIKPESPVQFYAELDEIPYSEATVPPTSQYNVFYYIYAGRDQGVYYTIYMKDPPQSGLYSAQPTVTVKQGFIAASKYASEKLEATLPSGYRQLCVNINGKDECGFGKVTTDFALNKLSEEYAAEQATKEVASEEECINGDSSLYNSFSLNIQTAASNYANPALYRSGITRVCSAGNPGQKAGPETTQETSKWQRVGSCDTAKKIGCWQDMESVKNAIKDRNLEQETIAEINKDFNQLDLNQVNAKIGDIWGAIKTHIDAGDLSSQSIVQINMWVDQLSLIEQQQAGDSETKAMAADMRFQIYHAIVNEIFGKNLINANKQQNIGQQIGQNVVDRVALDAANLKKDCEVTGYDVGKSKLNAGEQAFIKLNFQGNCKNWNQISVSMIKKGGDILMPDFPTYYEIASDDAQKGYMNVRLPFDDAGIYYFNISSAYQDEKNNLFTGKVFSGKGSKEVEVVVPNAPVSDCKVKDYLILPDSKAGSFTTDDTQISIIVKTEGMCKNWNKLVIKRTYLYPGYESIYDADPSQASLYIDYASSQTVQAIDLSTLGANTPSAKLEVGGYGYSALQIHTAYTYNGNNILSNDYYDGFANNKVIKVNYAVNAPTPNSPSSASPVVDNSITDCKPVSYTLSRNTASTLGTFDLTLKFEGSCDKWGTVFVKPVKIDSGRTILNDLQYKLADKVKKELLVKDLKLEKGSYIFWVYSATIDTSTNSFKMTPAYSPDYDTATNGFLPLSKIDPSKIIRIIKSLNDGHSDTSLDPSQSKLYPVIFLHYTGDLDDYLALRWNSNLKAPQVAIMTNVKELLGGPGANSKEWTNWASLSSYLNTNSGKFIWGNLDRAEQVFIEEVLKKTNEEAMIDQIVQKITVFSKYGFFNPNYQLYDPSNVVSSSDGSAYNHATSFFADLGKDDIIRLYETSVSKKFAPGLFERDTKWNICKVKEKLGILNDALPGELDCSAFGVYGTSDQGAYGSSDQSPRGQ